VNEQAQQRLRERFTGKQIGKLPRITCVKCRDPKLKCGDHQRKWCSKCKSTISEAHLHLDYVGHAEVTDRLLAVDPEWNWEPVAFDSFGAPALDEWGGLWIRLTVVGTTRMGYGHADGKKGGNAVKEAIGDAIRNAAMRFGVALDLWRKEDADAADHRVPPTTTEARPQSVEERKRELRGDIFAVVKSKGMSSEEGAADFTLWSGEQQLDIRTAGIAALAEYLDHVQRAGA
jgi:hypothetical protein